MKAKTWIVPAASCVALFTGCASQTAHNEPWTVRPALTVSRAENPQAWYDLGRYYQGQERDEEAAWALEKAVAADGALVEARNRLAVSYARLGRYDEAVRQLEAAIRIAPEAAHVHSNLGYVLYLRGDYREAVTALERAVALDPSSQCALNNLGMAYAQLGEQKQAGSAFARAADIAPPPVADATTQAEHPAQPAAPPTGSRNRVVEVAPNVYELRQPSAALSTGGAAGRPAGVEVSNGNGVTGMARRVAIFLKGDGYAAARLTNQPAFDVAATRVEYRSGYEAEARRLAAAMPQKVEVRPDARLRQDIGVRLVLGKDIAASLGYFEKAESTRLVQSRPQES